MKVGDLIQSRQCIWYFGSGAKTKRLGIIINIKPTPQGLYYKCWFSAIGYVELDAYGIDLVEGEC